MGSCDIMAYEDYVASMGEEEDSKEEKDSTRQHNRNGRAVAATTTPSTSTTSSHETTIQRMQDSGMCFDPIHYHSFRGVMLPPMFQNCFFCHKRIRMAFSLMNSEECAVKCIACHTLAHRTCALRRQVVTDDAYKCPVNYEIAKQQQELQHTENRSAQPFTQRSDSETLDDDTTFSRQSFPAIAQALQENVMTSYARENPSLRRRQPRVAPYPWHRINKSARTHGIKDEPHENENGKTIEDDTPNPESEDDDSLTNKNLAQHLAENINVGLLAGSLAGGVAGLALAGPAGAYAGYISAGSILVEGGVAWSLVAAGIGVGGLAGQRQHQQRRTKRVLELGGEHGNTTVVLVRPSVQVDPIWNQYYADAQKSTPSRRKTDTKHRDQDICQTSEDEIDTHDKILLLVNRTLNDKNSPSGHVFRYLVKIFHDRCRTRARLCKTNDSIAGMSPRAKRDDVHAVIKFVTASLTEERPELGAKTHFMEITATAVESLVFGLLYDTVFEEIVEETSSQDIQLWRKITKFEQRCRGARESLQSLVSDAAVEALKFLPASHSTGEKLLFCVKFLDAVSEHFVNQTKDVIGADALIKMVCQHLVLIGNSISCYAQVAFLEEFSRDDELLRGREGYALVTLQACLHLLQSSSDLEKDVFYNDHDDDCTTAKHPSSTHTATEEVSTEESVPGCCRSISTNEEEISQNSSNDTIGKPDNTVELLDEVQSTEPPNESYPGETQNLAELVTSQVVELVSTSSYPNVEDDVFFDADDRALGVPET